MNLILVLIIVAALYALISNSLANVVQTEEEAWKSSWRSIERMNQASDEISDLRKFMQELLYPYLPKTAEEYRESIEVPSEIYYQVVGALDRISEIDAKVFRRDTYEPGIPKKLVFWGPYGSTEINPSDKEAA